MSRVAIYDANVLYPNTLRDVLIRIDIIGLVQAKWTDRILDETFDNLKANRQDLSAQQLDRTRGLMNAAIRDVNVVDYEHRINGLDLPDPDDRHVLAAAIEAKAELIVTKNLKDFPLHVVAEFGIQALHPDEFLLNLFDVSPSALRGAIEAIATAWGNVVPGVVLDSLAVEAPGTARALRRAGGSRQHQAP